MIELNNIKTPNWQVKLSDPRAIVEDIDDIAQCIYIILATIKGTDPLRPEFGSDVYMYLDKPVNVVQPRLILAVYDALERWEPRFTVNRVWLSKSDFDKKVINIEGRVTGSAVQIEINLNI